MLIRRRQRSLSRCQVCNYHEGIRLRDGRPLFHSFIPLIPREEEECE